MKNYYSRPGKGALGRLKNLNSPGERSLLQPLSLPGIRGGKGDGGEGQCIPFARPLQDSQFGDCLVCACVCEFHPIYYLESY